MRKLLVSFVNTREIASPRVRPTALVFGRIKMDLYHVRVEGLANRKEQYE